MQTDGWVDETTVVESYEHADPDRVRRLVTFRGSCKPLDQGAPVSLFTATKALSRGGEAMVLRLYGHLGQGRHRAEEVEYRIEVFHDKLKDRLAALRVAV